MDHESRFKKIRFDSLVTNPVNFQRFACFYESYESLQILSTMARNESLKLEIREFESLRILMLRIRESGFANPNLKDSFRGFVSWKQKSQITRFVSFRKDSYTNPASLQKRLCGKVLVKFKHVFLQSLSTTNVFSPQYLVNVFRHKTFNLQILSFNRQKKGTTFI